MTEQDARARAIAEQAITLHYEWDAAAAQSYHRYGATDCYFCGLIAAALSATADTARAQAFKEAAKEVDVLIAQERERLRSAYTLPYDVPAQRIRSATITAYTVVVDLLRARATAGDTP